MSEILYFIVKKNHDPKYLHNIKDICNTKKIAKKVLNNLNNKEDFEIVKIHYTGNVSQWALLMIKNKDDNSKHLCLKMLINHYAKKLHTKYKYIKGD